MSILVPEGDRALTTGQLRGVKAGRSGGETEYRYELRKEDFDPFLLVGRYDEERVSVAGRNVIFWTRGPIDSACAQSLAPDLAATMRLYQSAFGPVWKHPPPIRVIEVTAAALAATREDETAGSVPAGALFASPPSQWCSHRSVFLSLAERELARTWFGWALRSEPGATAVLGSGAVDYAALLAARNRNPAARPLQVTQWLAEYDRLRAKAKPLPPAALDRNSSGDQWRMGRIQSALCLVALEDRFGSAPVQKALAQLVRSFRGRSAGLNELRSAVEQETGQDLYVFFRDWLRRAGIPVSFRSHHPPGPS